MENKLNIDLIKELGLDNLPLQQQKDILENAGEAIFGSIMNRFVEILDDGEKTKLDAILNDPEGLESAEDYLRGVIPNFDQIVTEEIVQFKSDSLEFLNKISA